MPFESRWPVNHRRRAYDQRIALGANTSANLSRQAGMLEKEQRVASHAPFQAEPFLKTGQASANLCGGFNRQRLLKHHQVFSDRPRNRQIVVRAAYVSVHLPGDSRALRKGENVTGHMAADVQRLAENNEVSVNSAIHSHPSSAEVSITFNGFVFFNSDAVALPQLRR